MTYLIWIFYVLVFVTLLYLIKFYLIEALYNKKRFELYKLRDDVCILATRGNISQQSKEYAFLVNIINFEVNIVGRSRDLVSLMEKIIVPNIDAKKEVQIILTNIGKSEELNEIASKIFCIIENAYEAKIIRLRRLLIILHSIVHALRRVNKKLTNYILGQDEIIFIKNNYASIPTKYFEFDKEIMQFTR